MLSDLAENAGYKTSIKLEHIVHKKENLERIQKNTKFEFIKTKIISRGRKYVFGFNAADTNFIIKGSLPPKTSFEQRLCHDLHYASLRYAPIRKRIEQSIIEFLSPMYDTVYDKKAIRQLLKEAPKTSSQTT